MAVTRVEEEIAKRTRPEDRRASWGHGAQTRPMFRLVVRGPLGKQLPDRRQHVLEVRRRVRPVEAREVRLCRDAQTIAEARPRDQVFLVDAHDLRRPVGLADGDRQRVALHGVDRQPDPEASRQARRVASERQHVGIRRERPLAGHDLAHARAIRYDAQDLGAEMKGNVALAAEPRCERRRELVAIAGLVDRAVDRSSQSALLARQCRLDLGTALGSHRLEGDAIPCQHRRGGNRALEMLPVAIKKQRAVLVVIVGDRLRPIELIEERQRVETEPDLVRGVRRGPARGAFAQELQRPRPELRIQPETELERGVVAKKRLDQNRRRACPGIGVAGRDHAGVGEARLEGGSGLAIDDHHLVAVPREIVGRRRPDDAGAQDQDPHGSASLTCEGPCGSPQATRAMCFAQASSFGSTLSAGSLSIDRTMRSIPASR
jgi:hypothetical protein